MPDTTADPTPAPEPFDPHKVFEFEAVASPRYRFSFAGKAYDFEPFALADALRPLTQVDDPTSDKFGEHQTAARKVLGLPDDAVPDPAIVMAIVITFWRWMPQAVRAVGELCGVKPRSRGNSAGTPTSSDASPLPTAAN